MMRTQNALTSFLFLIIKVILFVRFSEQTSKLASQKTEVDKLKQQLQGERPS